MATEGPSAGPCGNEVAARPGDRGSCLNIITMLSETPKAKHTGIHFRVGICHTLTMSTPLLPAESGKFSPRPP